MKKLFILFIGCIFAQGSVYAMDVRREHEAVAAGDIDVAVVQDHVQVETMDNDNLPPLLQATKDGDCELVEALLKSEVDVNLTDINGCTPLFWAAVKGHAPIVKMLLAHGALNQPNNGGETPLQWAEFCDQAPVAAMIKQYHLARKEMLPLLGALDPRLGADSLMRNVPHWLFRDIFACLKTLER